MIVWAMFTQICLLQIQAFKVAPQVTIWHDLQPNHGLHKTNTYHIQIALNGDSIKVSTHRHHYHVLTARMH